MRILYALKLVDAPYIFHLVSSFPLSVNPFQQTLYCMRCLRAAFGLCVFRRFKIKEARVVHYLENTGNDTSSKPLLDVGQIPSTYRADYGFDPTGFLALLRFPVYCALVAKYNSPLCPL